MRHLFNRGFINQWVFQEIHSLREALLASGNIRKHCRRKVELNGLLYVIERLPVGLKNVDLLTLLLMKGIQNLIFKQLFL
jgi:hypothetical protein